MNAFAAVFDHPLLRAVPWRSLAVPVLVFGARATELVIQGDSPTAALYLLASLVVLAITLAPLAAAAAVRIGLE